MIKAIWTGQEVFFFVADDFDNVISPGYRNYADALKIDDQLQENSWNKKTFPAGLDIEKLISVKSWSLEKCNDELGAGGHYSCHNEKQEAQQAVVNMLVELL